MLPLLAIGAGLAAAGAIGSYASGSMSKGRGPQYQPDKNNYGYNYKPEYDWTQAQNDYQRMAGGQDKLVDAAARARAEAERKRTGPSLAQLQMEEGQSRAALDARQMAANARGGPGAVAVAQRQAMAAQAEGQASLARSTGQLRAQEEATDRQLRQADYARELAALQASGDLAGRMRQGSMAMSEAEVAARMQAERYRQEGGMAYDNAMAGYDQRQMTADEVERRRKQAFWGRFIDSGAGMATMGAAGGGGGGGGGGGPVGDGEWNDIWAANNGGDRRYA
jgi:hypothetical protein